MVATAEFLIPKASRSARILMTALLEAAPKVGIHPVVTKEYAGKSDWLVLFGVGAEDRDRARKRHVKSGRRAILWDLGYFQREKEVGHLRVSIDHDHPQAWIERTPLDSSRWDRAGIELKDVSDPNGPIVLVGLGLKSKLYLREHSWERKAYERLLERGKPIIHRPKPGKDFEFLPCERDTHTPIDQLLVGKSLVVCRHSNVAVDAILAGVPFEAEDGAAMALKEFTPQARLDFMRRLSWWQWRANEAVEALDFLKRITE